MGRSWASLPKSTFSEHHVSSGQWPTGVWTPRRTGQTRLSPRVHGNGSSAPGRVRSRRCTPRGTRAALHEHGPHSFGHATAPARLLHQCPLRPLLHSASIFTSSTGHTALPQRDIPHGTRVPPGQRAAGLAPSRPTHSTSSLTALPAQCPAAFEAGLCPVVHFQGGPDSSPWGTCPRLSVGRTHELRTRLHYYSKGGEILQMKLRLQISGL